MADLISGTVLDENNEPLIGATITPLGTSGVGTTTDLNGKFTATNFPTGAQIEISYIGYKKQTMSPGTNLNIKMQEDSAQMDEVVVSAKWTSRDCNASELSAAHATAGKTAQNPGGNGIHCVPSKCVSGYKLDKQAGTCIQLKCEGPRYVMNADKTDCIDQNGRDCKSNDANAKTAKYKWENNALKCIIKKCNDGYMPNDAGTACDHSDGPCSEQQLKAIPNATKGELKRGVCQATECEPGFDVSGGKCVAVGGNCNPMPENAKSAHREFNMEKQSEICIIDECQDGYNISADKLSCTEKPQPKLSQADSEKKIAELRDNAQAMKDKEQSTANKLIGAAGIGATGIGGMQLASAMAEQNADEDAERDMAAYLATFKCDFGQGRNITGGETNIELPGGNQLLPLYTEYTQLASDLKIRKQALGMSAGIESETIVDKADTGLYDNVSLGKTDGAYTSVARALMDETSADAAEWAKQKSDTASKLKTGATVAGIGAAGSLVANLAVNSGQKKQNKSDEIINRYEALKTLQTDIAGLPDQERGAKCPNETTGTYPNCVCTNAKMVYNTNTNVCDICPGDKIAKNGVCDCPDGTVPDEDNKCTASTVPPKCDTTDANIRVDAATGNCSCINGYTLTENGQNCQCPTNTHEISSNGLCTEKRSQTSPANPLAAMIPTNAVPEKIVLQTKNLFALGKSTLTTDAVQKIANFAGRVQQAVGTNTAYCINVIGHTDKTGSQTLNKKLSLDRANAVKAALVSNGLNSGNITTSGMADNECQATGNQPDCRKVEINFSDNQCNA